MTSSQITAATLITVGIIASLAQARAASGPPDFKQYTISCRFVDAQLNVLSEVIMDSRSPKNSLGNHYVELSAVSTNGIKMSARITNVRWGFSPMDQFQVALSVGGKPYLGTSRSDLPIYYNFFTDGVKHAIACVDDAPEEDDAAQNEKGAAPSGTTP